MKQNKKCSPTITLIKWWLLKLSERLVLRRTEKEELGSGIVDKCLHFGGINYLCK